LLFSQKLVNDKGKILKKVLCKMNETHKSVDIDKRVIATLCFKIIAS